MRKLNEKCVKNSQKTLVVSTYLLFARLRHSGQKEQHLLSKTATLSKRSKDLNKLWISREISHVKMRRATTKDEGAWVEWRVVS